jgi:predicted RND superfamily exporter protein
VRELGGAGAELHVAVSIALRDVGRPIAECAFASVLFLTLSASGSPPLRTFGVLACASLLVATAAVLVVLPLAIRTLRPNFLIARTENASGETHSCVRDARNGGGG